MSPQSWPRLLTTCLVLSFNFVCCVKKVRKLIIHPVVSLFGIRMGGTSTEMITQCIYLKLSPTTNRKRVLRNHWDLSVHWRGEKGDQDSFLLRWGLICPNQLIGLEENTLGGILFLSRTWTFNAILVFFFIFFKFNFRFRPRLNYSGKRRLQITFAWEKHGFWGACLIYFVYQINSFSKFEHELAPCASFAMERGTGGNMHVGL